MKLKFFRIGILMLCSMTMSLISDAQTEVMQFNSNPSAIQLYDEPGIAFFDEDGNDLIIKILDMDFNEVCPEIRIENCGRRYGSDMPRSIQTIYNLVQTPWTIEYSYILQGYLGDHKQIMIPIHEKTSTGNGNLAEIDYFVDQNGDKIHLDLDEDYYLEKYNTSRFYFHNGVDGNRYIIKNYYNGYSLPALSDLPEVYRVFKFDKVGTEVKATLVKEFTGRAFPNPLHQGQDLTIDLDEALANDANLVVTSLSGNIAYKSRAKAGDSKIIIPAGTLRDGTYVYSVSDEKLIDCGKIIAK